MDLQKYYDRAGKLDLVLHISHLLNLCADGRNHSLFITSKLCALLAKSKVLQPLKVGVSLLWRR